MMLARPKWEGSECLEQIYMTTKPIPSHPPLRPLQDFSSASRRVNSCLFGSQFRMIYRVLCSFVMSSQSAF